MLLEQLPLQMKKPSDDLNELPKESGPGDTSSLHSSENEQNSQKKTHDREEVMDSDDPDDTADDQSIMCAVVRKRANYVCFKPLIYYNKHLDMNYYYKYFKPYTFGHRLLNMGYDCGCPKRRLHNSSCSWYDSDTIYMIETRADLSISEKAAQQKIYKIYMETLNNLPEECGCGTPASISYMGHSTKNVTSIQNPPNNQPNPSSFTDTPLGNEVKHSKDEEMVPLMDITEDITG